MSSRKICAFAALRSFDEVANFDASRNKPDHPIAGSSHKAHNEREEHAYGKRR